jgi:carbon storage regulator CsrA
MLVLSRRQKEKIMLRVPAELAAGPGMEIEVCVLEIRRDQVRLGITASGRIAVHREEVLRRIQAQEAAKEAKHGNP